MQLRAPPEQRRTAAPGRALTRGRCRLQQLCRRPVAAAVGYVPPPLDAGALQSEALVLGVTALAVSYWWFVLVPGARVNLAVNKRTGRLRDYLRELKTDDSRPLQKWFYSSWLSKIDPETAFLLRGEERTELSDTDGGGVEREESLETVVNRARRTPRFWSLDNPVLVATALSLGGAALFGGIPH